MTGRPHPHFGRPALTLGARVVGDGPAGTDFRIQTRGLGEAEHRWLEVHASYERPTPGEDELEVGLPGATLEALPAKAPGGARLLPFLSAARDAWRAARPVTEIMGILNVTPDSFSDGGKHLDPDRAIEAGLRFMESGATWLDVGGESTRPGAKPVLVDEELARVLPVIKGLSSAGVEQLSIDTRHARVARECLSAGARMVNDVGAGLDDSQMLEVVSEAACDYVLMHRQGDPERMQEAPNYGDVLAEVCEFLRRRAAACLEAGMDEKRLWIDPGIGFGKRLEHNLDLLKRLGELRSLGLPLLVGASRKSFIGHVTGAQQEADWARLEARDNPLERLGGTAAAITFCVAAGVKVVRVHDVTIMAEACAVAAAIQARPLPPAPLPC